MRNDQEIRRIMRSGMDEESPSARHLTAISRARRQVGQRDTLAFAMGKIWSVLAKLLAPLFAAFASRQAAAIYQSSGGRRAIPAKNNNEQKPGENE